MERVKLIQEQIDYLRSQVEELIVRRARLIEDKKAYNEGLCGIVVGASQQDHYDYDLELMLQASRVYLKEYTDVLSRCELLEPSTSDTIEIGSTFKLLFEGVEEELTLLDTISYLPFKQDNFISKDSILGKMLLGATVGDRIDYQVNKKPFVVMVTEIVNKSHTMSKED